MVPGMSGLLRLARPGLAALLALAFVLGIHGFVGAIHSVHHLPRLAASHHRDAPGHGDEADERGSPSRPPEEPCPVAAAALHLTAAAAAAPPALEPSPAQAGLAAFGTPATPRAAWREPARDRAPPSARPLSS
jgi:hypothetical protein